MLTYIDVITDLNMQVINLNKSQSLQFCQAILSEFVTYLPNDWLESELIQEQPYYRHLNELINARQWTAEEFEKTISALDKIMDDMGDNYPHNTAAYPLTLLVLLDNYIRLCASSEDFRGYTLGMVDEFMNFAEWQAAQRLGIDPELDIDVERWLDYPEIKQAFENIKTWIAKSTILN